MRHSLMEESQPQTPLRLASEEGIAAKVRLKARITDCLPGHLLALYRFFRTGDWKSILSFLLAVNSNMSYSDRLKIAHRFYRVSAHVPCEHLQSEILLLIRRVFSLPQAVEGCIVEAGCYKGGGTAKLSIAAKMTRRNLVVFDSFEGIPTHDEDHAKTIWGGPVSFSRGDYCGSLDEVRTNVARYGELSACEFVKGYFEEALPSFCRPIVAAFLDVDLASSTRTCLKYLWPLVVPGGLLFSHDGHLPLVLDVFKDDYFWEGELKNARPEIHGLGERKLIWMQKPITQNANQLD